MIKNEEIITILRRGICRLISRATPPANRELSGKYRRSSHPAREFLFVLAGKSFYLSNDSVYPCEPGTFFLFDSGMPHGHRYTVEDNDLLHLWGYFHERALHVTLIEVLNGQARNILGMSKIMMPGNILRQIENRWNQLSRLPNATEKDVENYMRSPMNAALDEAAFQLTERPEKLTSDTPMEDLKDYIRSRNGQACSLEHLALLSGYTRGYLAHKFKNETGMTVGEYIDLVRLEYVRQAQKRGIRQKEMAYELGFSSPTAFWNWFSKYRTEK